MNNQNNKKFDKWLLEWAELREVGNWGYRAPFEMIFGAFEMKFWGVEIGATGRSERRFSERSLCRTGETPNF